MQHSETLHKSPAVQSAIGCRCVQGLQEQRFLAGDINIGEGDPGHPCGSEQCCAEHRMEAVFAGRVGLQGYA